MPFIKKQLALAITLMMGATSLQYAQARPEIDPDSEWFTQSPSHKPLAPAKPSDDFDLAGHATTRNGLRVAHMLDNAVDTLLTSGELNEWEEYQLENYGRVLGNLQPGRMGAALEQLAGSQNANLATATQNSMKPLNASLLSAMRQPSDGSDTPGAGRFWLQSLGNAGNLEGQHGSLGLQQRTQGLILGTDWAVDPAWRVGMMGAKSTSELSANRFKGELDSWHLGGYAVRQDGPLAMRLGAIYSRHAGKNKRTVDVDFINYREQSSGQYTAQSQNAFAEMGYQVNTGSFSVEPFGGVGYQRYHRERYKEKGGFTALNVGAQTQESLSSTFGLRLASVYILDNDMALKPYLGAHWKHLYGEVGSTVRHSSAGVKRPGFNRDFTVEGTALDRDSLAVRTGLDLVLSQQHTVGLTYAFEAGSNSRNQGLTGQWTLAF